MNRCSAALCDPGSTVFGSSVSLRRSGVRDRWRLWSQMQRLAPMAHKACHGWCRHIAAAVRNALDTASQSHMFRWQRRRVGLTTSMAERIESSRPCPSMWPSSLAWSTPLCLPCKARMRPPSSSLPLPSLLRMQEDRAPSLGCSPVYDLRGILVTSLANRSPLR